MSFTSTRQHCFTTTEGRYAIYSQMQIDCNSVSCENLAVKKISCFGRELQSLFANGRLRMMKFAASRQSLFRYFLTKAHLTDS
jgi:hypothetical protein